jgi:hypothetical protein
MKHVRVSLAIVFLVLLFSAFDAAAQSGTPCNLYGSGMSTPEGFGVPWNTLSSRRELLVSATCDGDVVTPRIGTGAVNQYIYHLHYRWIDGAWQEREFEGANLVGNAWYIGSAWGDLRQQSDETEFFVAYVCQWTGTQWKCGCKNATCATPMWQLQAYNKSESSPEPDDGDDSGGDASDGFDWLAQTPDGPWNGQGIGIFTRTHSFGNQKFGRGRIQTIRFIAEKSGPVRGVMPYLQLLPQPGYSEGDGGRVAIYLYESTSNGQLGSRIGTGPVIDKPIQLCGDLCRDKEFRLTSPVTVTKGKQYHWVFEQVGDSGRISMGGINDQSSGRAITGGMTPIFGDNMVHMSGDGSPSNVTLEIHESKMPMFTTVYADGTHIGSTAHQGLRDDAKSVDGNNQIRVVLRPTTDRTVRYVYAAPWKESTQTNKSVQVQVKNSSGATLASAVLPASEIGYDRPPAGGVEDQSTGGGDGDKAPWIKASLGTTLTLKAGQTYYVEFSAPSGADVWFMSMIEAYDYTGSGKRDIRFAEIRGQFSTNGGSSWTNGIYRDHADPNAMYSVLLHNR